MANIFRRVEKKYIINEEQYKLITERIKDKMLEDEHGKSTICNIYFDTDDYDLIKHSIMKPIFKDKVRLRSYNTPKLNSKVYLEIKRKFDGVVSKRRIELKLSDYYNIRDNKIPPKTQIEKELDYYLKFYNLKPKVYLSYERTAYYDKDNKDFRITFDNNILFRTEDLALEKGNYGNKIISDDTYVMEIKTLGAIPIWLVKILNELEIRPGGFSKYGTVYSENIFKNKKIENL